MDAVATRQPACSIVMPCYNRAHDLRNVLAAYDRQDTAEFFELIAVDDCSTDGTFELLAGCAPEHYSLRIFRQERNGGPGAARNRGIGEARAPLIIIVGDDIRPAGDFVRKHLLAHRVFPERETAILGSVQWADDLPQNTLMRHIDGKGAEQFSYFYLRHGQAYDYRHFYTANISVKTELLHSLDKWFDTDFVHAAFEDVELSYRLARQGGMRIIHLADIVGWHYHFHTIWSFAGRQYRAGQMARLLIRKHPGLIAGFKSWAARGAGYYLASFLPRRSAESLEVLERRALSLAGRFEWDDHPALSGYYSGLLVYFFFKGWLAGILGWSGRLERVLEVHARQLGKVVRLFERELERSHTIG